MERARRWLVVLATLALITLTATLQYRLGTWQQPDATMVVAGFSLPGGLGPILLAGHVLKVLLLPLAVELHRRRCRVAVLLAATLFSMLATISVGSSLGALSLQRHERVATEASALQRETDLRAELGNLGARLKDIGWRRAVAEIQADITAEYRNVLWEDTNHCAQATTRLQRVYCSRLDRLKGELEPATDAEGARRRERDVRTALSKLAPTSDVRHPDLAYIAAAFGASADKIAFWRTLLIALTMEAAEALPLWFLALFSRDPGGSGAGRDRGDRRAPKIERWWRIQWPRRATAAVTVTVVDPQAGSVRSGGNPRRRRQDGVGDADATLAACLPGCSRLRPATAGDVTHIEAVAEFVAALTLDPAGRETGSGLYAAYCRQRGLKGWPSIPANAFGAILRPAIERVGGQKRKSNRQTYIGIRLPPV